MRITLEQLATQPKQVIDLLEIISIEGQQYMARLSFGDRQFLLSDKKGVTCLFRSAWQLQDTLSDFSIRETQVVHPSAYHEMIGMEPAAIEPLRIRVQRQKVQGKNVISVARLAILVGIAGLIPFIACVAALFAMPQYSVSLLGYFYLYSAGILAFMAGIYWPIAMQLDNRCYPLSPLVTMLLSQVFFVAAGIGLLLSTPAQIVLYTVAYLGLYVTDARWMRVYWPAWYLRMRMVLTLVAVTCQLTVGAWFFLLHSSHGV